MARPLRGGGGGGGGKGLAIKEKRTFLKIIFLFCCHLQIKYYLQLIETWTYKVILNTVPEAGSSPQAAVLSPVYTHYIPQLPASGTVLRITSYHVKVCWQVFLLGCYNIFQKIGLSQSKNCGEKKSCQNPFSAILRLKNKKKKKSSDGQ